MQGWHNAAQVILQILSNSAWNGVAGLCSLIGIPLAFLLARKSKINKPQEPHALTKERYAAPPDETRYLIRDGYHRAFLVKDLDVINSTNQNRYLFTNFKKISLECSR